jgi:hypothetical protein
MVKDHGSRSKRWAGRQADGLRRLFVRLLRRRGSNPTRNAQGGPGECERATTGVPWRIPAT